MCCKEPPALLARQASHLRSPVTHTNHTACRQWLPLLQQRPVMVTGIAAEPTQGRAVQLSLSRSLGLSAGPAQLKIQGRTGPHAAEVEARCLLLPWQAQPRSGAGERRVRAQRSSPSASSLAQARLAGLPRLRPVIPAEPSIRWSGHNAAAQRRLPQARGLSGQLHALQAHTAGPEALMPPVAQPGDQSDAAQSHSRQQARQSGRQLRAAKGRPVKPRQAAAAGWHPHHANERRGGPSRPRPLSSGRSMALRPADCHCIHSTHCWACSSIARPPCRRSCLWM